MSLTGVLAAQQFPIRVDVESTVDTSNAQISSVVKLFENYLNSKPDSDYVNPYWSEREQHQYKPYDLVGHTWWGSQYTWLPHCNVSVLSVSRIEDSFVLRTMLYTAPPKDSGKVNVISIFQTAAQMELGSYKLCNVLPLNARYWKHEQIGSIKYVFPPDHQFNRALAGQMNRFIDSLATSWQISVAPIEYYFADDIDRVAKVLGFDYWPAEGNFSGPRGFTDHKNRIVYSGGSDEWYPHEFVHILINPLFPKSGGYALEGYATLVGGSGGHDLSWHLKRNYEYLKDHPNVDALTYAGAGGHTGPEYFIGGMLCKMAEEKGGKPMLKKFMSCGPEIEDVYVAIKEVFGVERADVNKFLRKSMAKYAAK